MNILIIALLIILCLFVIIKLMNKNDANDKSEHFYGGYYYPYDHPFYHPYFYTGCNENVFGDLKCLPIDYNPFW